VPSNLLSVEEAQNLILSGLKPVEVEEIPFSEGSGRVLAEDVIADLTLPPFPNSAMDGYAVRSLDLERATPEAPISLEVRGEVAAGQLPQVELGQGEALKISTGAQIPAGADAVIPVERIVLDQGLDGNQIAVAAPVETGGYIRPAGQDVRPGDHLLGIGHKLRPQDLGMLASVGKARIRVFRQPRVALFSSGDELLEPGQPLLPGKIHDSNRYALSAAIEELGGIAERLPIAADTLEEVCARLELAASRHPDLILSSAGVSVGDHDYVRSAVERSGELTFWRVNIRPGKPLAYGHFEGIPFLGLPGNPVSSLITFEVFARPAIARLGGLQAWQRVTIPVCMSEEVSSDGRETYLRAIAHRTPGGIRARPTGSQDSGMLSSLVKANAIVIIPAERERVGRGEMLDAWLIGPVFSTEEE
jgi:molybdopterin molybdotransferase